MRTLPWRIIFVLKFLIFPLFISAVFADPPGPPGPGGDPSGGGGGVPVGAPIDDGVFILLALGVVYGCYKIYEIWKRRMALKEEQINL